VCRGPDGTVIAGNASGHQGLEPAKVKPNRWCIACGHPVATTGANITTKGWYQHERLQRRYALVTMWIGGGQGMAAIFERT